MNYEKMYNDLKGEFDTLNTTFENYKQTKQTEYDTLKGEHDTLVENSSKEIQDLKQANISLYLKIPQTTETPNTAPSAPKKSLDQIINEIGKGI